VVAGADCQTVKAGCAHHGADGRPIEDHRQLSGKRFRMAGMAELGLLLEVGGQAVFELSGDRGGRMRGVMHLHGRVDERATMESGCGSPFLQSLEDLQYAGTGREVGGRGRDVARDLLCTECAQTLRRQLVLAGKELVKGSLRGPSRLAEALHADRGHALAIEQLACGA
jgi:hypothetical protein